MEPEISLELSEVKIEIDVAEEPEQERVHHAFSCEHMMTGVNVMTEPPDPDNPQHVACKNIKAEPAADQTMQHALYENIKAEPAADQTMQHALYENIKAEPAADQTMQHALYENIKSEAVSHGAEDSEDWGDFRGVTVKLEPVECSLQQEEKQASSQDFTDCCEPDVTWEPASEKKRVMSAIWNSKLQSVMWNSKIESTMWNNKWESRQRPSPDITAVTRTPQNSDPTHVSQVSSHPRTDTEACHSQKIPTHQPQLAMPDCGRGRLSDGKAARCHVRDMCSEASNLKRHMQIHTGEKPFACDVCDKGFNQAWHLEMHKCIHLSRKPFVCDVCSEEFSRAGHLKIHKRKHSGEKPFVCDVCSKAFTQASNLKVHKLIHTGVKPFVCDLCGKAFTQAGNLKKHKLIHTGVKPFVCDVCFRAFTQASILKRHCKLNHTGYVVTV